MDWLRDNMWSGGMHRCLLGRGMLLAEARAPYKCAKAFSKMFSSRSMCENESSLLDMIRCSNPVSFEKGVASTREYNIA